MDETWTKATEKINWQKNKFRQFANLDCQFNLHQALPYSINVLKGKVMTKYFNRREASEYIREQGLPCAPATLAKMATVGGGPIYRKFSRNVVYTREDLDAWILSRLSAPKTNTAA